MDFAVYVAGQDGNITVAIEIDEIRISKRGDDVMTVGLDAIAEMGGMVQLDGSTVWSIATMLNGMVEQMRDWTKEELLSFAVKTSMQDSPTTTVGLSNTQH